MRRRLCQLDVVHHVTLRDEEVLPACIIVIDELCAPAGMECGCAAYAARARDVVKGTLHIPEQSVFLVGKSVDKGVWPDVVIIVLKIQTHSGEREPIVIVGHALEHTDFLK